jgi:hypothetical protein
MPWNESYYPDSMKHQGQAIRIGIAKAKQWAARHRAIPWRGDWAEGAD